MKVKKRTVGFLGFLFVLMTALAFPASGQTAVDGFRVDVNDTVTAIRTDGVRTYIAGVTFTTVNGTARRQLARINPDGSLDTTYNPNPQNASVQGIEISGSSLIVVGGFTAIGGAASGGIARLNFDGTNDGTFTAAVSGAGPIAVQPDGKVIIGGHFTTVGGQPRNHLARFNADGSLDPSFTPNIDNAVFGITLQPDGKILINGQFSMVNGQARWNFARLNADGSLDSSFFVNTAYPGAGGTTYTSAVQADGKILVGGNFARYGDSATVRNNIARLNPNGSLDTTFSLDPNGSVYKIIVQNDDRVLLSGAFTTINGAARNFIARLSRSGSVDTAFVASASAQVNDIATLSDRRILIGGAFTSVNGFASINRVARLYPDGRLDGDTNPNVLGGAVFDILSLPNGLTLIAGGFTSVGGATRQGLARVGWTGANDSAFANPQLVGNAYALAVQSNGQYLVGGEFTSAGGTSQARLARFNPNGAIDGTFAPSVTFGASTATVNSIAVQTDGKVIIAGQFSAVNGTTRTHIARLNSIGQLDATFTPPTVDFYIDTVALQADGKVLIGGVFETVAGQARAGLARLNADGTLDTTFNPVLNGIIREVYEIKLDRNGKILIGGSFQGVSGNGRPYLARLNADGTPDGTFAAAALDSAVLSIQLHAENQYMYIAGRFSNVGNFPHAYIAMLNSNGSVNSLFQNTAANDNIQAMTVREDGRILIGGNFTSVSGQTRNRFAGLSQAAPQPGYLMLVSGSLIQWYRSGIAPSVARVVFEHSTDGVNYTFLSGGNQPFAHFWTGTIPPGTPSGYIRARGFYDLSDRRSFYEREIYYHVAQNRRSPFDFDADGKTDISIFRPSDGSWWYWRSSDNQVRVFSFGLGSDVLTPGDFTGDGRADIGVFRPSEGKWYVQRSEDNSFFSFPFGTAGDIPAPADYDGDGRADAAVFRPSAGTWYILNSGGSGTSIVPFGAAGDKPVAADFDGDGKADIAVFRPSDGSWWYLRSIDLQPRVYRFGLGTDKPVVGDYSGDGKAELAVFRPSIGEWFFQRSEDNSYYSLPFGSNGDIPAPGDYDGDGRFDMAVFRPATGNWFIQGSTAGTQITSFGTNGDRPVPNAFVP